MDDPSDFTPSQWQARRGGLLSQGAATDDPRVIECDHALAYWRCRRIIDRERALLAPEHVPALADMLRHAHSAVSA